MQGQRRHDERIRCQGNIDPGAKQRWLPGEPGKDEETCSHLELPEETSPSHPFCGWDVWKPAINIIHLCCLKWLSKFVAFFAAKVGDWYDNTFSTYLEVI